MQRHNIITSYIKSIPFQTTILNIYLHNCSWLQTFTFIRHRFIKIMMTLIRFCFTNVIYFICNSYTIKVNHELLNLILKRNYYIFYDFLALPAINHN